MSRKARDTALVAAGTAVLLGLWQLWAARQPAVLVPSPAETADALGRLAADGVLYEEVVRSLGRALTGSVLALLIGVAWGLIGGGSSLAEGLGRPLRALLLGIPPIVPVVMGMVWWGSGGEVPVFVATLVSVPVVAVAIAEAVRALDPELREMATAFRVPLVHRLRHLVLPALTAPLLASVALVTTTSLRTVIMAELLAAPDGVGARIATARTNLATDEVFAWAAVAVAVALLAEHLLIGPLRRRARRWRGDPAAGGPAGEPVLERTIP
ncbi:ABC transporter permease subunit [Streptomyces sp. NPDC006798]|uniref:ABC transporter permease n=1 Tax=Streptomyces sp. NPDC006798 TaxID=3155462 RepID=UPI0033F055E8